MAVAEVKHSNPKSYALFKAGEMHGILD